MLEGMQTDIEHEGVEKAIDRLAERFPDVPREGIADLVHGEHATLQGRPVRDYVPVLVERAVRAQLRDRRLALAG